MHKANMNPSFYDRMMGGMHMRGGPWVRIMTKNEFVYGLIEAIERGDVIDWELMEHLYQWCRSDEGDGDAV